jgi:2-polyprenyl-6-methoxyphenol hydroxylase-like FAD-dependent oxidoreductase
VLVCQGAATRVATMPPAVFTEVSAPELRFGCYPFRNGLNWFAFVRATEADELERDPHGYLLERTRDWTAPAHEAIAATPAGAVTLEEVVARQPLERWTDGGVALLGDAAHAMTPFTGQGACQAIEDAVVLSECLRDEPDVAAALGRYEARRRPRTVEIWQRSWAGAVSAAKKTRTVDPARKDAFAARFERVVWAQLEQTIVEPF